MATLLKPTVAALVMLAMGCHGRADAGEVIAHPLVTLSADEIKDLYSGDKQLAGNLKLVPIDNAAQQADFLAKVIQTDAARYAARWTKKAFREGLAAPVTLGSDAEAISFVKSTPGAVAYVAGPSQGVRILLKY